MTKSVKHKKKKKLRTSTTFTMVVGGILVLQAVLIGIFVVATGALQGGEIVSLVYAYLIGGAAFFGINIGRITAENVANRHSSYSVGDDEDYSTNYSNSIPQSSGGSYSGPPIYAPSDTNQ